ncbi:MAG: hypothetical protein STSR0009_08030 [Methanoregula sp.]
MRINASFSDFFPTGELRYWRNGMQEVYHFRELPKRGLNNKKMGVDGRALLQNLPLTDLTRDIIVLLIYGNACVNEEISNNDIISKCDIGNYIGKIDELNMYIKQRYIFVSRQTGGAKANTLGQLAQNFVKEFIERNLNLPGVEINPTHTMPGIRHMEGIDTSFDIVLKYRDRYIAIEVMFQVTTNSTIERKQGQAQARYEQIENAGYKIAYVIDGAGSFARQAAVTTITTYSHCNVAFSPSEFEILCNFIREYFSE